jgi:hypothetical protein
MREFSSRVSCWRRQPARTGDLEQGSWAVTKQRIMRTNWEELACSCFLTFIFILASYYLSIYFCIDILKPFARNLREDVPTSLRIASVHILISLHSTVTKFKCFPVLRRPNTAHECFRLQVLRFPYPSIWSIYMLIIWTSALKVSIWRCNGFPFLRICFFDQWDPNFSY